MKNVLPGRYLFVVCVVKNFIVRTAKEMGINFEQQIHRRMNYTNTKRHTILASKLLFPLLKKK